MSKNFDWDTARLLTTMPSEDGTICKVYRDAAGNGNVRHEIDQRLINRQAKIVTALKDSYWNDKSFGFFNERVRGGDRVIGQLPKFAFVEFPHITEDPKELMKFFDKYPQWKRNPAKWTRTTPSKKLPGGYDVDKKGKLIVG